MMRAIGLLSLLLCLACSSAPESPAPVVDQGVRSPASAVEAALRKVDRPRERLDRKLLQGAWSVYKNAGRTAPRLSGDHPVLIVRTAPDLALGDLIFLGTIEVSKATGREGFAWEAAETHLKGRAQENGADLVLLAQVDKDPVGRGLRRVVAAAYRYVSQGIR